MRLRGGSLGGSLGGSRPGMVVPGTKERGGDMKGTVEGCVLSRVWSVEKGCSGSEEGSYLSSTYTSTVLSIYVLLGT